MITSEAGASVYSASKLAQQNIRFGCSVRGAISVLIEFKIHWRIGKNSQSNYVTISAWCRSKLLKEKLDEKVEYNVN